MSGDLENTSMPIALYQRMPQLPSVATTFQRIPRLRTPEAIAHLRRVRTRGDDAFEDHVTSMLVVVTRKARV